MPEPHRDSRSMVDRLNDAPLVTILLLCLVTIVAVAGAVVTIVRPSTLNFRDYAQDMTILTAALALSAGIGRGAIASAERNLTSAIVETASLEVPDTDDATTYLPPAREGETE